jgi:hypothetical protein
MAPIKLGDGTGIDSVRLGDGTEIDEITVDGDVVFSGTPPSLVSHWTFDNADTSGSTAIDIVGNNDGTINGATTGVSGANETYTTNEAYDFDGNNDFVDIGTIQLATDSVTFAVWLNLDARNQQNIIHIGPTSGAGERGAKLSYNGNANFWRFTVRDSGGGFHPINGNTLNTGQWYHIVACYDGDNDEFRAYEDGQRINTRSDSFTPFYDTAPSRIGRRPVFNDRHTDGVIDDVRIYNDSLTDTQVTNLYNNGSIQ